MPATFARFSIPALYGPTSNVSLLVTTTRREGQLHFTAAA